MFLVELLAPRLTVSPSANVRFCFKVSRPKFLFRKQLWEMSAGASSSSSVVVLLDILPV